MYLRNILLEGKNMQKDYKELYVQQDKQGCPLDESNPGDNLSSYLFLLPGNFLMKFTIFNKRKNVKTSNLKKCLFPNII